MSMLGQLRTSVLGDSIEDGLYVDAVQPGELMCGNSAAIGPDQASYTLVAHIWFLGISALHNQQS